jgi:uncharacterized sporulation protein YeaH/YhbH (DUF444 family)
MEPACVPRARDAQVSPMISRIDKDHSRFREIVRGKIRQNLRKYISRGDLMSRKGQDTVTIPMPQIDIPRFTLGGNQKQGVGQGEGEPGDPVGGGDPQQGAGQGQAGQGEGEKSLEVEVTLEGRPLARGQGRSKKLAEQEAARAALALLSSGSP